MQLTTIVCLAASLLAGGAAPVSTVESRPGYNSWPMIQAIGSRLVCTYSRGTQHDVFEGVRGTWAKWSDDDGRTWHGPHLVADDPAVGETPIGKGLDSSGAALFWVRAYAEKTKRHELYRTKDGVTFERIAVPALDPVPVQITDVFHVPGRGLVALWFAGNYLDTDAHKSWGDLVSTDDGRTWTQRTIGSELAKDQWPTEPSVARLPDGRLLCIARSERYQPEKALQWQLESTDGGLTWTKSETNIRDVMASTPSLVYDEKTGLLYNYYYERGKCVLKRRVVRPEAVWGKPLAWPEPEVVSRGSDSPWDSGNACATTVGQRHFIAYYTGKHPDTSVVVAAADVPDFDRLADMCWMWGHETGQVDGAGNAWGLDVGTNAVEMTAGALSFGLRNLNAIRWDKPGRGFRESLAGMRRVTWPITGYPKAGVKCDYDSHADWCFEAAREMPNVTGFELDDFFNPDKSKEILVDTPTGPRRICRTAFPYSQLRELRKRMDAFGRPLDLRMVVYDELFDKCAADTDLLPALELADTVTYWTWCAKNIGRFPENFARLRRLVPGKRVLIGVYLWDFGDKREMPREQLERLLAFGLDLWRKGEADGFVFLCSSLCSRPLPAVEGAREWLVRHADERRPEKPKEMK